MASKSPTKLLTLRRTDHCVACGSSTPAGTRAWWDTESETVMCDECYAEATAAGSEKAIRARAGAIIGSAWPSERLFADRLEQGLAAPAVVLHDRVVPGCRTRIDHLIVARSGVWVVSANHDRGKVERRDSSAVGDGGWELFVGGRPQTSPIADVAEQVGRLRSVLADADFDDAPVRGALCLYRADWDWLSSGFVIDGVLVVWPSEFLDRIKQHHVWGRATIDAVVERLVASLPHAR